MSSVKSLLAQKRQANRLTAPHTRYSSSGALSCSLCSLAIKSDALWGAHAVSKQHRTNLRAYDAQLQQESLKRAREEEGGGGEDGEGGGREGKRARDALPADFFADPSQAPEPREATPEAEAAVEEGEEDDPEWAAFEASLAPPETATTTSAQATLSGAAVVYEHGAPKVAEEGEEDEDEEEEEEVGETEEERRDREEREAREEVLERIEEEEREQREADEKVNALKRRLEAIRAARKAKA